MAIVRLASRNLQFGATLLAYGRNMEIARCQPNFTFERDGGIDFQIGLLDKCEPVWKIDGQPVEDWKALP